ncbi:MAG: alanine--glyoxylate aminotransferase family protein [Gemmataceae bacterium]|nr:alanine--glyoxylate aminotransferase family protein [Gemmataceae bacterium]
MLRIMSTPLLGHLDPQFLNLMNESAEMLRFAYRTKNPLTLAISATGTAGMETCLVNLLEPKDKVAVFALGYFGQRMIDIAGRTGAEVTAVEGKWGEAFDLQLIRDTLKKVRPKVLAIVHAETSTGVLQPGMDEIGKMCRETDTLLVADCVTSLGCTPLEVDAWGIDAAFSCSQKGLSCPPGLSPVTFSPRAVEAMEKRKTKVQSWYLDLSLIRKYVGGTERSYHHTAPISMNYALHEGLRLVLEEGLEARWARHLKHHKALKAGLLAMGLKYTAAEGCELPHLNAVRIPEGMDDLAGRKMMLSEFGIEIGGGLGDFKGRAWRIGLMGTNCKATSVFQCLGAMEQVLTRLGAKIPAGAGMAAANAAYAGR